MTCIVALKGRKKIYIGGDSAGIDEEGLEVYGRKDPKVFRKGPFLFGFTDSFRMGQIIHHCFDIPKRSNHRDSDYKYMCTDFMTGLMECFDKYKYTSYKDSRAEGGTFIVVFNKEIYTIMEDFQVQMTILPFVSVGCGASYAMGALHALNNYLIKPEEKVRLALEAASEFSAGVRPPYLILST